MIITDAIKIGISNIAKEKDLALVVLFGSQATGHTHFKSDIDIGFVALKKIDYSQEYQIERMLAAVFDDSRIQAVNLRSVSPELNKQVMRTGILLYEKDHSVFDLFKIRAYRNYVDTALLRRMREQSVKTFIASHA